MKRRITRRGAIQGLGIGAAALGLGLRSSNVRGQVTMPPKRVIFFCGATGSRPGLWEPQPVGGAPAATETEWQLNDLHMPLAAHRDRLSYFENLHMISAEVDPIRASNAHINGGTHAMTCANRSTADRSGGISIDQHIVQRLEAAGHLSALPSLEVQAADWPNGEGTPIYRSPGNPLPFLWNPSEAYDRAFPDGRPDDVAVADPRPEQRSRVLQFALDRFGRLDDPRMSRGARLKLEQHADQLRSIQSRLAIMGGDRGSAIPDRSILDGLPNFQWSSTAEVKSGYWRTTADLNSQILVAALHANVTRVATFYVNDASGPMCPYGGGYYREGDFGTTGIHDLTHRVNQPRDALASQADPREVIRQQHLRTAEVLAQLLDRLAAAIEPDGTSLLDHTLVVWNSQISNGSHSLLDLPWVLAGDAQGAIRAGRYHRSGTRLPHNDLYVSVARAIGVDITSFGNPAVSNGPLSGLEV